MQVIIKHKYDAVLEAEARVFLSRLLDPEIIFEENSITNFRATIAMCILNSMTFSQMDSTESVVANGLIIYNNNDGSYTNPTPE